MTRTTYRQLQPTERMRIEIWKAEGVSLRALARRPGRAPPTVLRGIFRNTSTERPTAGDLIKKGAGNKSSVAVLVERMSRAVLLAKMPDSTAASALQAFTTKLQSLVAPLRQTMTYDQGREMSRHADLTAATGVRVYFCDPHIPWQRGTCENTNGLLRQYIPKGTDLSVYSQQELDAIADSLNTRPRQTLGWRSPLQVLAEILANPRPPTPLT